MLDFPVTRRTFAFAGLWTVAGVLGWLLLVQGSLILFAPRGQWQWPDVYQVEVVEVDKDSSDAFLRDVQVTIGGELETITLPRKEALELHPHDSFWVLDNFCSTGIRAPQYRLTPWRLLAEYPPLLLSLILWIIVRLRRSRWGLPPDPADIPPSERKVYRDDFHARAQRHADPGNPPSTSGPGPV